MDTVFPLLRLTLVATLAAMLAAAGGCKRLSRATAGAVKPIDPNKMVSIEEIRQAYRSVLATVQTTWETKTSLFSSWKTYGQEGVGIVIACDGRTALVLTSRQMVDPSYRPTDSRQRRNVAFRVGAPGAITPGSGANARLVAIHVNDADLALLRIGAPWGDRFAIPLPDPHTPKVGDEVVVVGPPAMMSLAVCDGVVNNFWYDNRLGANAFQIRPGDGRPPLAGAVFTRRGGRLVGILGGAEPTFRGAQGDLFATSSELLGNLDHWDYLIDEAGTRRLLAMIQ